MVFRDIDFRDYEVGDDYSIDGWQDDASDGLGPTEPRPANLGPILISSQQSTAIESVEFHDSDDEDDFDFVEDIEHFPQVYTNPNLFSTRSRMATEFAEGRLETTVNKPQKELPGTKDAFVSYLVTTQVSHRYSFLFSLS